MVAGHLWEAPHRIHYLFVCLLLQSYVGADHSLLEFFHHHLLSTQQMYWVDSGTLHHAHLPQILLDGLNGILHAWVHNSVLWHELLLIANANQTLLRRVHYLILVSNHATGQTPNVD